ncbi:hypothetical protein V5O48_009399 [Marasmius crinis-equi]|uniref:F-box domain-containing protein n=1 Tax=Marasmius crinis-equi TaxID=585013 RepID=A0ABR3FB67_9AGAR
MAIIEDRIDGDVGKFCEEIAQQSVPEACSPGAPPRYEPIVQTDDVHPSTILEILPPEIFQEIAQEVCSTEFASNEDSLSVEPVYPIKIGRKCRRLPVDLALVCRWFRDQIYAMSSLWSRISIRLPCLSHKKLDSLRTLMSQSKGRLLQLLIRGSGSRLSPAVKAFLVEEVFVRACRIDCEWDTVIGVDYNQPLLFPRLTIVQILSHGVTPSQLSMRQQRQIKALIEASSLKCLIINTIEWRGSDFIVIPRGLVEFHVTDDIRMSRLLGIAAIPHLQSLSISIRVTSFPAIIPDLVLPQVKCLSLRAGARVSSEVLRHIWAPRVEELQIDLRTADRDSTDSLLVFLRHSALPPLHKLSWRIGTWTLGPATSLDQWKEVFHNVPTMKELDWTWYAYQDDWEFDKISLLLEALRDVDLRLPELRKVKIDFEGDSWPVKKTDIEDIALEFIKTVEARKQVSPSLRKASFDVVLPHWCYGRWEMKYVGASTWDAVKSRKAEVEERLQDCVIKLVLPERMYSYRRHWRIVGGEPGLDETSHDQDDVIFGLTTPRAERRFEEQLARRENSP